MVRNKNLPWLSNKNKKKLIFNNSNRPFHYFILYIMLHHCYSMHYPNTYSMPHYYHIHLSSFRYEHIPPLRHLSSQHYHISHLITRFDHQHFLRLDSVDRQLSLQKVGLARSAVLKCDVWMKLDLVDIEETAFAATHKMDMRNKQQLVYKNIKII